MLFDKYYVVYVETEYNEPLNSFIRNNIEYIRKEFPPVLLPFLYFLPTRHYAEIDKHKDCYHQQNGQQQGVDYCRQDNLVAAFLFYTLLLRFLLLWSEGRLGLFHIAV